LLYVLESLSFSKKLKRDLKYNRPFPSKIYIILAKTIPGILVSVFQ